MVETPKRPDRNDEAVLKFAAEMAIDAMLEEMPEALNPGCEQDGVNREDTAQSLMRAFRYTHGDGFKICKALDRDSWETDREMMEFFDRDFLAEAHERFVSDWIKAYRVVTPFTAGDAVSFRLFAHSESSRAGTVVRVDERTAEVIVNDPSEDTQRGKLESGWVLPWDRVTLAPVAVEQAS